MSEEYIQVPPDSTGKQLRAIKRTIGTNEVYEKTILVAEPVSGILIDPRLVTVQSGIVIAQVSGETIVAAICGQIIVAKVSGEIVVGKVSGETLGLSSGTGPIIARISGETIRALSSGETYIAKVSGETIIGRVSGETIIGKVSGEVVSIYGYSKDIVSGAVIRNIKSGGCVLHTVTVNDYTSGFSARIRDASSGAAGSIIAQIFAPTRALGPATLNFDCVMLSGIVVDTSGATWNITVTYR